MLIISDAWGVELKIRKSLLILLIVGAIVYFSPMIVWAGEHGSGNTEAITTAVTPTGSGAAGGGVTVTGDAGGVGTDLDLVDAGGDVTGTGAAVGGAAGGGVTVGGVTFTGDAGGVGTDLDLVGAGNWFSNKDNQGQVGSLNNTQISAKEESQSVSNIVSSILNNHNFSLNLNTIPGDESESTRNALIQAIDNFSGGDLAGKLGIGTKQEAAELIKSLSPESASQLADIFIAVVDALGSDNQTLADLKAAIQASKNPGATLAFLIGMMKDEQYQEFLDFLQAETLVDAFLSLDTDVLAGILETIGDDLFAAIMDLLPKDVQLALSEWVRENFGDGSPLDMAMDIYWFDKILLVEAMPATTSTGNRDWLDASVSPVYPQLENVASLQPNGNDISSTNFQAKISGNMVGNNMPEYVGSFSFMSDLRTGEAYDGEMRRQSGSVDAFAATGGSGSVGVNGFELGGFGGIVYDATGSSMIYGFIDPSSSLNGQYSSDNWTGNYEVNGDFGGGGPFNVDSGTIVMPTK